MCFHCLTLLADALEPTDASACTPSRLSDHALIPPLTQRCNCCSSPAQHPREEMSMQLCTLTQPTSLHTVSLQPPLSFVRTGPYCQLSSSAPSNPTTTTSQRKPSILATRLVHNCVPQCLLHYLCLFTHCCHHCS